MKKLMSLAAIAAFALAATSAIAADSHEDGCCAPQKASAPAKAGGAETAKTYTCPMHPKVTSDKPGKCPECGMNLVVKKAEGKTK